MLILAALLLTYPAGVLPDPALTPGATDPRITQQLVTSGHFTTAPFRHVTLAMKKQVCAEYHVAWADRAKYEIDHFISIEFAGAEDVKNLWPEPLHLDVGGTDMGAKTKDRVEDLLGAGCKSGRFTLARAQALIRDWPSTYRMYIGPLPAWKH